MSDALKLSAFDQIARESAHFSQAPSAFLQAWKRGVRIAGPAFFGDGTRQGLEQAEGKWSLRPDLRLITEAFGPMSSGQKVFLAALVSFYNARESAALFKRCGVEGLADLGGLDLQRRQVIADLILHYVGW